MNLTSTHSIAANLIAAVTFLLSAFAQGAALTNTTPTSLSAAAALPSFLGTSANPANVPVNGGTGTGSTCDVTVNITDGMGEFRLRVLD